MEAAPLEGDATLDVLWNSRTVWATVPANVQIAFRREHGVWRATALDCEYQGRVTDTIVEPIVPFTTLESLRLSAWVPELGPVHQLSAQAIRSLASLRKLRSLALPWTWMRPDIVPVCELTKLESLDVSDERSPENPLAGLGDLKALNNLRKLRLRLGRLNDDSMETIKQLATLEELDVGANDGITDAGTAKLEALRNLQSLAIDELGPKGIAAMREMPHLEHLDIFDYTPVAENSDLSGLTSLKWLTIRNVFPTGPVRARLPAGLKRLDVANRHVKTLDFQLSTRIEHLELNVCPILGVFAHPDLTPLASNWLASLPELRELTLIGPIEQHTKAISGLHSLRALTLQTVEYVGVQDEGMRALAGLQQLESLTVVDYCIGVGCRPIDEGLDVLPNLPSLRHLSLRGFPRVTSQGLANVWKLTQLRTLRLDLAPDSCPLIDDEALIHISAMRDLEVLSIGESGGTITDKGIRALASLRKLRRLDLGKIEGYSDEALASLMTELPNLQEVTRSYSCREEKVVESETE